MDQRLLKLFSPPLVIDPLHKLPLAIPFLGLYPGQATPPWMSTGRSRPRYFDGRFLAARDLERDQIYLAQRQAEYLQAAGTGVIHGLDVSALDTSTLRITAGAAITLGGQLVVVRNTTDVAVSDGATVQRLDQALGVRGGPKELARRGTGVYALLARPIEYSANPIGFYPASIEERRAPQDGEIVEAVAFTLAPYHDPAIDVEPARQRAALARRLFVERATPGLPVEAVPLALVQLQRGFIRWVDPWLVRREIGDAYDGMGSQRRGPRAIAEAHIQQYHAHLAAVIAGRARPGGSPLFSAPDELAALPPAGLYPATALDTAGKTDRFFPPAMPRRLQVVPYDELATIVDEALAMPPIDLTADARALAATPVTVLVGLDRATVDTMAPRFRSFRLRPIAAGPVARDPLGDVPPGTKANPRVPSFARLRTAIGDTEDGVVTVERHG